MDLNNQQIKAIQSSVNSSCLVVAGAGSGKTSVLTQRIHYLVNQCQIKPYNIMAMTFTNKAAKEIKQRLIQLNTNVAGMWLGTFHSIGYRIIREFPHIINMPDNCYVIDNREQKHYIKHMLSGYGYNTDAEILNNVQQAINHYKQNGWRSNKTKNESYYEFYKIYEKSCCNDGVLDFGELLLGSYEIINHPKTQKQYQKRFTHVHVDEFQDTNWFQYKWLLALTEHHKNIFVVGDFDQSIYSFRGAFPDNLFRIKEDYPGLNRIKLEQNYRSQPYILEAANSVIEHNNTRQDKKLWSNNHNLYHVYYKNNETEEKEVFFIAQKIKQLLKQGYEYQDIAILYRINSLSRQVEKVLVSYQIPFVIYGGLKFFEREEVKHAMAYLRLAHDCRDNLAFQRVYNMPSRGIGNKSMEQLINLSYQNELSLYDSIQYLDNKVQSKFNVFKNIIDNLNHNIQNLNLFDSIDYVINHCGLIEHYEKKKENERIDNIHEILASANYFIQDNPKAQFDDFINMTTLDSDFEKSYNEEDENNNVSLMTIHNAKGMEFPVVFIIGLNENIFPHALSQDSEKLEEERRMMYVALTRSKEKIYICDSQKRFIYRGFQKTQPSRFIKEIPQHLIKPINS